MCKKCGKEISFSKAIDQGDLCDNCYYGKKFCEHGYPIGPDEIICPTCETAKEYGKFK